MREMRKRRRLTQSELAEAAGVSVSLVRKLEQERVTTRMETARSLAVALRVPTATLLNRDAAEPDGAAADLWDPVRRALDSPPQHRQPEEPPTLDGLRSALGEAQQMQAALRVDDLAGVLPGLIRDADALADSKESQGARRIRMEVMRVAGWALNQARHHEAAAVALDRAMEDVGDSVQAARIVSSQCFLGLRQGRLELVREAAVRWADELEPRRISRAPRAELTVWGDTLLTLAAVCIRDNRPGETAEALRLAGVAAAALARETPENKYRARSFGPVSVVHKQVECQVISGRPDVALQLASSMPPGVGQECRNDRMRHLLDVADSHARLRDHEQATDVLLRVHRAAPQWLANQRYARDILGRVVERRRKLTPEMLELAEAVRLPL